MLKVSLWGISRSLDRKISLDLLKTHLNRHFSQRRHLYHAKLYLSSIYNRLAEKHTISSCTLHILLNNNTWLTERRMQLTWSPFDDLFLIFIWQPQCQSAVTVHRSPQNYSTNRLYLQKMVRCTSRGREICWRSGLKQLRECDVQFVANQHKRNWEKISICLFVF